MKKIEVILLFFAGAIILVTLLTWFGFNLRNFIISRPSVIVNNFEECVAAGNPILETYPRQCKTSDGKNFVEEIGNALEKQNLIRVFFPMPNASVKSPITVRGEARGTWFFEASFPIKVMDANGVQLGIVPAQAKSDWMTEDFVEFEAVLNFQNSPTATGTLVLERDNPSGLPQNADQLTVPIRFGE